MTALKFAVTGRLKRFILDMPFFRDFTQPKYIFTGLFMSQSQPANEFERASGEGRKAIAFLSPSSHSHVLPRSLTITQ